MSEPPFLVEPVPALAQLSRYSVRRPPFATDLVLDFNESTEPLPLSGPTPDLADAHCYPWTDRLVARLAERLGVAPDRVIVTCGADDALERAVRSVCCPGRRAVMTQPTYGMPRRYAILAGADIATVPWWSGPFPVDRVLAAAGDDAALLLVVSPNNPTGAAVTRDELAALVEGLPRTLVILDQAYREFADPGLDLTELALAHPNVVLVRTFSKAWGGAALRAGYAVGDPRVVDWMVRVGLPFPVARPTLELLAGLVADGAEPECGRIERVRRERAELAGLLAGLGAEPLPSQASFVLARFDDAPWVRTAMAALGIAIRGFPGRVELDGWLRTTLPGDDGAFARLADGFRTVLRPEAVLLDLDGVIADESVSYRRAVVETAATFGVEIAIETVNAAKAGGDANNDWELTRRLLAEAGIEASLDEVTRRFEAIYQGTVDAPGLRSHERLLVEPDLLRRLAAELPLAIVTGRPRGDAERFLAEHGIAEIFSTVVVLDDAPSKPDPAPVHLALERLGLRHAWMVGDTPDDLRAARGASVLPIGIVAPGDDPAVAQPALAAAGAARILDTLDQLLEVLP
ncbi:MAG: aminotransferase class I/II-fold pyridoxal phosphate-dependent enzyme [Thermoanaerobaculales bacterium]|jgi:histidinol-phosphate aminotransferase|nr:aminotransferase class I/II-fold pyridoxal phosphate-dependent enzyme [Thermoanaerobaculales bacterium]